MIAYKMMKKRKNGTLGSLFINASAVIPVGEWLEAEPYRKKGFAFRVGWHCCFEQNAPHLKLMENRVWVKVEVEDWKSYDRPESQGGAWVLANKMKIIEEI
jgi:hypothetical protein